MVSSAQTEKSTDGGKVYYLLSMDGLELDFKQSPEVLAVLFLR
jgi:hypothetical protein